MAYNIDTNTGTPGGTSSVVGPTRSVNVSLSGSWSGPVYLERKIGGSWRIFRSYLEPVETMVPIGASSLLARLSFAEATGVPTYTIEQGDDESGVYETSSVGGVGSGAPSTSATAEETEADYEAATLLEAVNQTNSLLRGLKLLLCEAYGLTDGPEAYEEAARVN